MRIAIMQPYFLPYIGYWQLINSVDKFVIYDDVQFIKSGWINRNRIKINGREALIRLNIKKEDFRLNINQRTLVDNYQYQNMKIIKSIKLEYSKAPHFEEAIKVIIDILNYDEKNLSRFIINSIYKICEYLDINTEIMISSQIKKDNELKGQEKVININKILKSEEYINTIGGKTLYNKEEFKRQGIELYFLKTQDIEYIQEEKKEFTPNLSIVDIMMFNSKDEIKEILNKYELV